MSANKNIQIKMELIFLPEESVPDAYTLQACFDAMSLLVLT